MSQKYSKIIQGCMTWGVWGKKLNTSQMVESIHHCVEQGLTTFDHADIYGDYTTEGEWGYAFAKANIAREQIQIISKCGIQMKGAHRPENVVKHYQYTKEYIISSAERSLKELRADYLDLFLLHRPSPLMNPAEIAEAVEALKSSGKIKDFGVSNFTNDQVDMLRCKTEVASNQIEISLTSTESLTDGTLDYCISNNVIPMSWSPLGSFFKEDTPQNERISEVLSTLSNKYSATTDQLLIAWLLKHPAGIHPVIGTTNFDRIEKAIEAQSIQLELQDWFAMLEASTGHEVA
ncbi:aldo/keto reductase family oxidoreductase [Dokdonia sp. Hel_I_53]|uniref:aldo/keto reductase n=1 Tax=Dokdonia sp. Hel_I_53 TaxID=1566287 RepID=UPI00119A6E5C|nr:aldo/keto reductase [Dokdonia sp. Hel_I_53]TVZ52811.1 putative oxidoreductase [Dokdonia sp. Hel_I_53]